MSKTKLLPIALLYTGRSDSIDGATRMQKLVFLAQEETELPESFEFYPDRYGPYSHELADALDEFQRKGLVERNVAHNEVGNPKHIYSLTTEGVRIAKKMLDEEKYSDLFDPLDRIKREYNSKRLDHLLQYVYGKYESYTVNTELDLDRLFDPDADSELVEPDLERDEEDFLGPGPGEWKELNSSADELFPTD